MPGYANPAQTVSDHRRVIEDPAGTEKTKGWPGRTHSEKKEKLSYLTPNNRLQTKDHTPSADFAPSDTRNLQAGQKVEHQKFGFGEVLKMEGAAHNPIATVKFEHNGEKKIMLNYAKLRIVE